MQFGWLKRRELITLLGGAAAAAAPDSGRIGAGAGANLSHRWSERPAADKGALGCYVRATASRVRRGPESVGSAYWGAAEIKGRWWAGRDSSL